MPGGRWASRGPQGRWRKPHLCEAAELPEPPGAEAPQAPTVLGGRPLIWQEPWDWNFFYDCPTGPGGQACLETPLMLRLAGSLFLRDRSTECECGPSACTAIGPAPGFRPQQAELSSCHTVPSGSMSPQEGVHSSILPWVPVDPTTAGPHRSGTTQHPFFCVWLTSPSITSSRSTRVAAGVRIPSLLVLNDIPSHAWTTFYLSLCRWMDG